MIRSKLTIPTTNPFSFRCVITFTNDMIEVLEPNEIEYPNRFGAVENDRQR